MKPEHKMMDLLILSNRKLSETNALLTNAHIKTINLLDKSTNENDQLYQVCQQIYKWLLNEKYPNAKQIHMKKKLYKIITTKRR